MFCLFFFFFSKTIPIESLQDYDGGPIDPCVQWDCNEFFNMLFDRLESCYKGNSSLLDLDLVRRSKMLSPSSRNPSAIHFERRIRRDL